MTELVDRLLYAKALVMTGELPEAEVEVAEVLEARPEDVGALSLLAKIKHMRGELSAAVACWAECLARSKPTERARMHLLSMLHMAQDPEKGAGEFVAVGQFQLVRKPAAYLALEEAFALFVARKPTEARAHCRRVAEERRSRDRDIYKLAVLAEAWLSQLSGDLEGAYAILEALGRERGFETDHDRVVALVELCEQIGTSEKLQAAVNICRFLESTAEPLPVLGRLALLYRRLGMQEPAKECERRHEVAFRRGMHRISFAQMVHVAARRYLPLRALRTITFKDRSLGIDGEGTRERAVAAALVGDFDTAREGFGKGGDLLDMKYLADVAEHEGDVAEATRLYVEALRGDPTDAFVNRWLLDTPAASSSSLVRDAVNERAIGAGLQATLDNAVQLAPFDPRRWRRLARLLELRRAPESQRKQVLERAEAQEQAAQSRANPVGRVLAAAVYHFIGQAKGIVHEVWASREPCAAGQGGMLPKDHILGNVTEEMQNNVRNTFIAVREYARAKLPHRVADLEDYVYTYKVTKEDEPSGGTSAGLPTALACLSVFLQRPVPQDLAFSGVIQADAHDVLIVGKVGESDYKVKAAYHRNLRAIILPASCAADLRDSALVPQPVCDEIVRFVSSLDDAVRITFGEDIFA